MAALQRAHAAQEVAAVLAVGADFIARGTETLSLPAISAVLDELEEAWQACCAQPTLSDPAREQALRHYHAVHTCCARAVPLTAARWQQWLAAISSFTSDLDAAPSPSPKSNASPTLTAELVADFMQLFQHHRWGHTSALKVGLDAALSQADTAATECTCDAALASADEVTLAQLESALAKPLRAFTRLAAESTHLFGSYAVVGRCERTWLSETVAAELGQPAEAAVEALVRRSFKRDLQVPSSALPQLLEEYEASEVEERKTKAILGLGQATLRSPWMRAAAALQAHEEDCHGTAASAPAAGDEGTHSRGRAHASSASGTDTQRRALEEALTRELKRMPKAQGCLAALGVLTGRLIDEADEASAAVHSSGWFGLSVSQTNFYLYLLHQWFASYVASHHRWSMTDVFCAADDSDLWSFLLARHTACLAWSLATAQSPTELAAYADVDSRGAYLAAVKTNTEKLRTALYSVAHCLQVYRGSVTVFTSDEKREARLRTAAASAQRWMQEVGAATFCRSLLNDMWSAVEAWQSAPCDGQTVAVVEQQALLIEAEVKMVLYDAMQMLGCADAASTERLEAAVEGLLEFCQLPREASDASGDGAMQLTLPIVCAAERFLRRISANLRQVLSTLSTPSEAHLRLYTQLVEWIKQCIAIAAPHGGETGGLWDMWRELISAPLLHEPETQSAAGAGGGSAGGRGVTESGAAGISAFVGYAATASHGGSRASRQGRPGGGLAEVCWERRSAAKQARQHQHGDDGDAVGDDARPPADEEGAHARPSRGSSLEAPSKRPRPE